LEKNVEDSSRTPILETPPNTIELSFYNDGDSLSSTPTRSSELTTKVENSLDVPMLELISKNIDLRFYKGLKRNLSGSYIDAAVAAGFGVHISQSLFYDSDGNDNKLGITYVMKDRDILEERLFFNDREISLPKDRYFRTSAEQVPFEEIIGMKSSQLNSGIHFLKYEARDTEGEEIVGTAILNIN